MRGQGRIYQRGERWWIAYYVRGKEYRESAGSTKADAKRFLKVRQREIHGDRFITPQMERTTVNQVLDYLVVHLQNKGGEKRGESNL